MKATVDQLKKMLVRFDVLPDQAYQALANKLSYKSYKKGEMICKEGEVAKCLAFLTKGVFRQYYLKDGIEYTSAFSLVGHNSIFTSYESFSKQQPSTLNVEAVEYSEVFRLKHGDLAGILKQWPHLMYLEKVILERYFIFLKERFYAFQHMNATQRYLQILEKYPELIRNIEQQYIASYIGIAPPSLARIKRNIKANKAVVLSKNDF